MSLTFLETIGLTKKEADLYELLLKLGETPANEVIKQSKLKRATAYKSLYSLEKKGLVKKDASKNVIRFRPESPDKLMNFADQQHEEFDRAREDLRTLIPKLVSDYTLSVEKPIVRTFEGAEGIKKAHLEILSEKKEILACVLISEKLDKPLEDFWPEYYRIRKKHNIFVRSISPDSSEGKKYKKDDSKQLRETRLISHDIFDFSIEKNICGNKVAFFSRQEGKLIATIIENPAVANTERSIFELAWKQAAVEEKDAANHSISTASVQQ